ncbi:PAS fold family protein [Burkholderia thailandensis 34]|uniref:ATP-binding protein n=1 Tax=Burkholderia thailandensis TaxID=57975 RepID=UPI0005D8D095|nr:ATP-binding protein [Burkholderia thailandensis]AJY32969.1 PAS fold family protein [Burkholderia thailandensis 34]AOJ60008.1 PAS domain-containing sensor histidine kinase [Burkholderia thailandensis]KXF59376.1 PAS domain-containing sensor histidine kinase [Burkholderia thailandensis]PNE78283.1 PAS domain-containing sensor histidine kinase [Burkholderia thailandensis]
MSESTGMQMSEAIVEQLNCGVFSVGRDMRILAWNGFMQYHTGRSRDDAIGQDLFGLFPELPARWLRKKLESVFVLGVAMYTSWEHRPYLFRFDHSRPITGTIDAMRQNCSFVPLDDGRGGVVAVGVTIVDATDVCIAHEALQNREKRLTEALAELTARHAELSDLNRELAHAHQQLLQSEKLAAIGQLAAGIAHEINNPVGFVLSNVNTLGGYLAALIAHAHAVGRLVAERQPQLAPSLAELAREADLDYLCEDAPALVDESKEGLARVRKIVVDLRDFSRVDSVHQWEWVDIHHCIESTLNIVRNEVKYAADLVREYAPLPMVRCIPSQVNQVVLNLVVNAAQSYASMRADGGHGGHGGHGDAPRGTITIRTGVDADEAARIWFEVVDAGCGIAPENLKRIFDPFFTTKPVGKGTGLGLSVAYGIVSAHGGEIAVSSAPGAGTTFRVTLPVEQAGAKRPDAAPGSHSTPAASGIAR